MAGARPDPGARWRRRVAALRGGAADVGERLAASRAIWVALYFAALVPLIISPRLGPDRPPPPPGSIAAADVIAGATIEFVDEEATRAVRDAARDSVRPVFDLDSRAGAETLAALRRSFQSWRRQGAEPPEAPSEPAPLPAPPATLEWLASARFDEGVEARLRGVLEDILRRRIVGSKTLLPRGGEVSLRDPRAGREWSEASLAGVLSLDEARAEAARALRAAGASPRERAAVEPFLRDLIAPNLTFNGALTESRRQEAVARVEPLIVRIPQGKVLLRRGEVVGDEAARLLANVDAARRAGAPGRAILGNLLLAGLLLFFMSRYVFFYQKAYRREGHLFALLIAVTVLCLTIDRGFIALYDSLVDTVHIEPYGNPEFYRYMVPMATGAMLTTLLVNPRVGMAFALFYVPLFGMMTDWDVPLLLFCLISNLAGIYGITTYRRRTAPIKAGLFLGGVNAAAILAIQSVVGGGPPVGDLIFQMACGFGGGILVAVLVSFLLPLLEALFNILTDVRLLELSNLNNPLLRRLAVEAPGSYNHSVIVGTLAEAAAEAIGANALFCRVAAYYHDVGKMLKPTYFIENQKEGNRHDHLSPHMSALVIASHVKEGYELARSYGLPKQVLDIIPQHHGTRKINYFYEKAKREEGVENEEVREADFRYPGPKPQTREAAIFMLSDSIEAAARTLEDPSPARFKGLIRTIISDVVLDDQFNECDLTFSDLEKASAAFLKTLSSIYHHRIDYPGFDFDKTPERPFKGSRTHVEGPPGARRWGQ